MQLKYVIGILLLSSAIHSQQCDLQDPDKLDCGYFGIDQNKCQAKGCCWKPASDITSKVGDTPWCFYPGGQNPCQDLDFSGTQGAGFDSTFYSKMYSLFDANINIQGKGGVVAAPDRATPGGSYYYHWMRDGALTMRTYMELNKFDLSKIEEKMKAYVDWVNRVQH